MIPVERYRKQYLDFFKSMTINTERQDEVWRVVDQLRLQEQAYIADAQLVWTIFGARMPWQVLAVIDLREGGGTRSKHIANGDSLNARTIHVPKGIPTDIEPPYSFQQGIEAALNHFSAGWGVKLSNLAWDVPTILCFCEAWNGFMYRTKEETSSPYGTPYLWSFTNHYKVGYVVADGSYDPTAICNECGVAPILQNLGITV